MHRLSTHYPHILECGGPSCSVVARPLLATRAAARVKVYCLLLYLLCPPPAAARGKLTTAAAAGRETQRGGRNVNYHLYLVTGEGSLTLFNNAMWYQYLYTVGAIFFENQNACLKSPRMHQSSKSLWPSSRGGPEVSKTPPTCSI